MEGVCESLALAAGNCLVAEETALEDAGWPDLLLLKVALEGGP